MFKLNEDIQFEQEIKPKMFCQIFDQKYLIYKKNTKKKYKRNQIKT